MDRKKGIAYMCIIVLVMMAVGSYLSRGYDPTKLSEATKAQISREYKRLSGRQQLVWFDENGGMRETHVHRYFGTYGNCVVMLVYQHNRDSLGNRIELPCAIGGLSYQVKVPTVCDVYLYNKNPNCRTEEILLNTRYMPLEMMKNAKLNWLTDAQIEQITREVEAWVAAGNY